MTLLNKALLLLLYLMITDIPAVTGLAFMTSTTFRVNLNQITAFRRSKTSPSSRANDGVDVSVKAGLIDYQDRVSGSKTLQVETSGFGNADAGVETFRNEMIGLVYTRSLDRMNELSMN